MSLSKQPEVQVLQRVPTNQGLAITQDVRLRQTQAEMFARYNLAMMTARSWVDVEAKLLLDCDNPEFAKEAFYSKPAGRDKIEGLSIRFAERARQHMRNVQVDTSPEMEDEFSVHYRTTVIDLESNIPESETFKVEKTVERKSVKEGDTVISQRTNSSGETVYLIPSTEDQLNTKLRAQSSKVKRTLLLALVPADVRARCLARCKQVARDTDAKDPAAATKSIVMAFISIGVESSDLKDYLGKPVGSATAEQVSELRSLYALIRDGEMTWQDVMQAKEEREAEQGSKAAFVAKKQKERDEKKNKARGGAQQAPTQPATRRGRGTAAAADAGASTTPPASDAPAASDPPAGDAAPAPQKPRASRRGGDEDPPSATDPASNPATA